MRLDGPGEEVPNVAGVYCFLAADGELLYVGMAGNLRQRLRQHAGAAKAGARAPRLNLLYERTAAVRWEELEDEAAAAAREADLIVGLRPAFNAAIAGEGRWNYIVVTSRESQDEILRFTLSPRPEWDGDGRAGGRNAQAADHRGAG